MKTKLSWKKKWLNDKSGYWYSSKVPILGWEYIIEVEGWYDYENSEFIEYSEFTPGIFYSKLDDDFTIITKKESYKRLDAAKAACEKHLRHAAEKFNKWLQYK